MEPIYRVCGDRINNYTGRFSFPDELPEFDKMLRMRKVVEDDIIYAFLPNFPKTDSRYSDGTWSVLYTAQEHETAIYEVAHHFREGCKALPLDKKYRVGQKMIYKVSAIFRNQVTVPSDPKYVDPDPNSYSVCWDYVRGVSGCCSLKANSARKVGGVCYPIFDKSVIKIDPSLEHRFTLRWYKDTNKISYHSGGNKTEIAM